MIPCSPNMVTVRNCSNFKTSWKSVVFRNKVRKNSRYFVGVLNETIIPLALVGYEMIIANSALRTSFATTVSYYKGNRRRLHAGNFSYSYFEKGCRKKNVHAIIPKGNMWYDQYTFPDSIAVEPTFVALNIRPLPLVPIFQISLKNSELKTTHNTFRDCRVHFFRQPFTK